MPNILVRGHMRFDDSEETNSFEDVINKITNCCENADKSAIELNDEMTYFLKILSNRTNYWDNLIKIDESELKERINKDSRIIMKEIFSRYISLLKNMNLSFDDLLE